MGSDSGPSASCVKASNWIDDDMGELGGTVETIRATGSGEAAGSNERDDRTALYNIDKQREELDGKKYNT